EEEAVLLGLLLDDLVDDLLLLEAHDLLDALLAGELEEVGHGEFLELGEVDLLALHPLVLVVPVGAGRRAGIGGRGAGGGRSAVAGGPGRRRRGRRARGGGRRSRRPAFHLRG